MSTSYYSTLAKVQSEFKSITFTNSQADSPTAVTTQHVYSYLADADAEINSRLSVKYTTPISGTESLVVMAMIETWLVKHRILERIKVHTGDDKTSQTGTQTYRKMAMDLINEIVSGKVLLTDATLKTTADGVRSYNHDNADDTATANIFQRSVEQW